MEAPTAAARRSWTTRVACALSMSAMLAAVAIAMQPWFRSRDTFGFQDWDVATAQRWLTVLSLRRFGQFPGWNPYACGGFPSWGYAEGAANLVSPWLPLYLALPVQSALRLEALGMALIGTAGAYVLAGRHTRNVAMRALVAVAFAANGRWAGQLAVGHVWHLAFAWTPWCLYYFERASSAPSRVRDVGALGLCLALQLYAGGIYPLPHTVLALGVYAAILAIANRTWRPVAMLALAGAVAIGLAAPKLFPVLVTFQHAPRWIDSVETESIAMLWTALTSHEQGIGSHTEIAHAYGWHEWGTYIGVPALAVILAGVCLARERRAVALLVVGIVFVVLSFGAFAPYAPWSLLHRLTVFRSQHVPARFQYVALLVLGVAASSSLGPRLDKLANARAWLQVAAAMLVALLAVDIGFVARQPMAEAMVLRAPSIRWRDRFHTAPASPWRYEGPSDAWVGGREYLAMRGNVGVFECYSAPNFGPRGARPVGVRGYRGDAWIDGAGDVAIVSWSPARIVLAVHDASEDAEVVYNGNAAPGWRARIEPRTGAPVETIADSYEGALGVRVPRGDSSVVFSYRPPGLLPGLAVSLLTVVSLAVAGRTARTRGKPRSIPG